MNSTLIPIELPYHEWSLLHSHLDWIDYGPRKKHSASYPVIHHLAFFAGKGEISGHVGRHHMVAANGEWLFVRPSKMFTFQVTKPLSQFIQIGFTVNWTGGGKLLTPRDLIWKTSPLPKLEEKIRNLLNGLKERKIQRNTSMALSQVDAPTYFWIRHLFDDWFSTWVEEMAARGKGWTLAKNIDERILAATKYLEEHPLDQQVDVSDAAQRLGLSLRHLTLLFQKQYGMPPKAYRMKIKLESALLQLRTTQDGVKEIATRLGYTPTWFGLWIKRETGMTPLEIRNNHPTQISYY